MTQAGMIVETAKRELGYHEQGKNITKYAKYFDDLRKQGIYFYNYNKQGAEWCDIFVDYLFATNFGPQAAMSMLFQPERSCGAGCKWSAQYYKAHNRFDHEAKYGDQIFFGRCGNESHTGIVIGTTPTAVITIEGNSCNEVQKHTYSKTNSSIAGYGHPLYNDKVEAKGYTGGWPVLPTRGYFMKNDKGVNVQKMQNFLKWYDSNFMPKYGCDGKFGNETLSAVISFEGREGITTDGKFGPVCLAKAKEIKR